MREKHLLQDRIELLGPVRHSDVRDVSVCISVPERINNVLSLSIATIGSCPRFHILEYLLDRVFRHRYP